MQMQSSFPIIEVQNLDKSFRGVPALKKVSMTISQGEMVALVGASGSGKSTLLRHLNGLQIGDRGTIKVMGKSIQDQGKLSSQIRLMRSQIGFISQQFNLVNRLSVLENVLVGTLAHKSLIHSGLRLFSNEEKTQALAALERVGILEQAYKRASLLSGGQQQRVAIARCLMQKARIILADEPVASLDPESSRRVMELLTELNQDGITVITSLHQVQIVRQFFERSVALKKGEVCCDCKTVVLDDERLNTIYGAAVEELVLSGHGGL
jgi:phosphonate transport system ATP-binding protein